MQSGIATRASSGSGSQPPGRDHYQVTPVRVGFSARARHATSKLAADLSSTRRALRAVSPTKQSRDSPPDSQRRVSGAGTARLLAEGAYC
jgi:hypothetical protein